MKGTRFSDSEGKELPFGDGHYFYADLCDFNDGKGPDLTVSIPEYFEVGSEIYDSFGTISVPIKDVLEQYLREIIAQDGGVAAPKFIEWIRDYADRLQRVVEYAQKSGIDESGTCNE